jgi:hypothetical protein
MPQSIRLTLTALGASALAISNAHATSSGLNNIPTADTAPDLVPVIQLFSTWGEEHKPDHSAGMKIGFGPWDNAFWGSRFEAGVDGHYAPGDAGPAVFQLKYALQPWEKGQAIGIGSANIAVTESDRDRTGQPFSYAVLSQDFKFLRLHAGYGLQHDGNAAFVGIDKTFKVFDRSLMLRSDAIQIQNERQWLASVGALYEINRWLVLESWGSFPVETGNPTFTLKLNFVLDWSANDD